MGNARRAGALARVAWHQERAGALGPPSGGNTFVRAASWKICNSMLCDIGLSRREVEFDVSKHSWTN